MKIFSKIDNTFAKILEIISVSMLIAMTVIILLQVITRNVFSFSLGKLVEYPVYLMIFAVWIHAILVARDDDHLCIELLDVIIKNKKVVLIAKIIMGYIVAVTLILFSYYSFKYVGTLWDRGQMDTGTGLPLAVLEVIIPFSTFCQGVYYIINMTKLLKGVNDK